MDQIYEYILAIAEEGSFKNAAQKLHVTQPALSIALKKYEEKIGLSLFDRRMHPFLITPAGQVMVQNIRRLSREEEKMLTELADLEGRPGGELTIAATHYVNACILPTILNRYMEKYPDVKIHLLEKSSGEALKDFLNDTCEIACYANSLELDIAREIPIYHDNLYLVVPNKFLDPQIIEDYSMPVSVLSGPIRVPPLPSLSFLEAIPFISMSPGDRLYIQTEQLLHEAGIRPHYCLQIPQSTTAWHMACAGIGATLIPGKILHTVPYWNAEVSVFSYASAYMQRTIFAGCKVNQYISVAARRFIALCRATSL